MIDWSRFDAMTAKQRHAAAMATPDAQPIPEDLEQMRLAPRVKTIRRAFAAHFDIPIGTLRDWEQGREEPDAAAKAYLRVIAREPDTVRKAIRHKPQPGLDKRHRDKDGEIRRKNSNTLVGTLRKEYGDDFAKGYRVDAQLWTVVLRHCTSC